MSDMNLFDQIRSVEEGYAGHVANAVAELRKEQSKAMLLLYRRALKPFNLSRHKVRISSGMGSACVIVEHNTFNYQAGCDLHGMSEVESTLRWLDSNLNHEWADYLNGEVLNKEHLHERR